MNIKKADFAGSWYPGSPSACEKEIKAFLSDTAIRDLPGKEFLAGIVPHAGWYFSGALACRVIKHLSEGGKPDVIAVFGKHMRPRDKATIMVDGGLETPFGVIGIHDELAETLAGNLGLRVEKASYAQPENTVELQLPFIRYFFPEAKVVALGVPPSEEAGRIGAGTVEAAKKMGLSIKTVGSTDLTHYGPNYGFSPHGEGKEGVRWVKETNDPKMIERMLAMDVPGVISEALSSYNACCGGAVAAAVSSAKALGAVNGELLAYTTSYDKSPNHSLVGYAGVVFG
jgi:AmmeMemoRadiSam system protein B